MPDLDAPGLTAARFLGAPFQVIKLQYLSYSTSQSAPFSHSTLDIYRLLLTFRAHSSRTGFGRLQRPCMACMLSKIVAGHLAKRLACGRWDKKRKRQ